MSPNQLQQHLAECSACIRELRQHLQAQGSSDQTLERLLTKAEATVTKLPAQQVDALELNCSRELLDHLPVIVLLLDRDGRIVSFNRFMAELSGYTLAEVRGKDWFNTFLPPRDRDRIRSIFHAVTDGTTIAGNSNPIITKSGDERQIEWFASLIPDGEEGSGKVLSAGRDMTDYRLESNRARESQARFESLFQAVLDPILGIDASGHIVECNPAVEQVFGWKLEELLGQNVSMLMGQPFRDEHDGYLQRFLRTRQPQAIGRVRQVVARRKSGDEFPAEISLAEVSQTSELRFVGVVRDVSKHTEVLSKLAQTERLAAIGELAAGVAHEVNNPVNTILNCAQLIQDGDQDPELPQDILHEGDRIATIVQGLLSFARERDEEFHEISLGEVIEASLTLARRRLEKSGIDVVTDLPEHLPCVRGKFQQLEQVILNLLINARDALLSQDRYPKTVTFSARSTPGTDGAPDMICLMVRDNGPGIAEHCRSRVFEPFFTTKRDTGGTGLGLSISHGIIESHGGRIQIRSEVGAFTEIELCLPRFEDGEAP